MVSGEQIRQARQSIGMSQGDLASRFAVSLRTVQKWEGNTPCKPAYRLALAALMIEQARTIDTLARQIIQSTASERTKP